MQKKNSMRKRAAALIILISFLVSACGHISGGSVSSLEIETDGTVRASSVESFDKDYYDADELEAEIRQAVETYNEKAGEERVYLDSSEVKNQTAKVVMFYKNAEDYAVFNSVTLWDGKLADAVSGGTIDRSLQVKDVSDSEGDMTTVGNVLDGKGKNDSLLILEEPLLVKVPGRIVCCSTGVTVNQDGTARVGSADDSGTLNTAAYIIYR
jgi:hypothetical protein